MDFTRWVDDNNIDPAIVSRLKAEDYCDIEGLKELKDADIKELGLTAEQESKLSKALEALDLDDCKNAEFDIWASSKDIKPEIVAKLKNGGYDDFHKLCLATDDSLKGLEIPQRQFNKLKNAIAELRVQPPLGPPPAYSPPLASEPIQETDFTKFLQNKNVTNETTQTLLKNGCNSKEMLMMMEEKDVDLLNLLLVQRRLILTIIKDMKMELDSANKKMTSADAFRQFLVDIGLEETTITVILDNGFKTLDSLRYISPDDLRAIGLGPGQCDTIESVLAELKNVEKGPIVEDSPEDEEQPAETGQLREMLDEDKLSHSNGKLSTVVPAASKSNWTSRISGACKRFKDATKNTVKTGIENLHNYFTSQGIETGPSIVKTENGMRIMKLPLRQDYEDRHGKVRRCIIGNPGVKPDEKTIMIVGATGAGKSTLTDGLCNYIFGTKWEENHRFKLIDEHVDEKKNAKKGQAVSQTEWITIYTITCGESNRLPFTLNLIDTPGFGDTRGIKRDQQLIGQIEALFKNQSKHGIDSLDAVCFVAKAPDARLTLSQRYIFDSILSIFGNDIADNILVMITFADGAQPPVLGAIKEAKLPHKEVFLFNNSALFANNGNAASGSSVGPTKNKINPLSNSSVDGFSRMFWDMGEGSFKNFFGYLRTMKTKSLTLTRDVLEQRRNLKDTLNHLEGRISLGLSTMNSLEKEKLILEQNKQKIKDNENFTYSATENYTEQENCDPGEYVTHCLYCNTTCHEVCWIPNDDNKEHCWAMSYGNCTICKHKCHWKQHKNTGYRLVNKTREVVKEYGEMVKEYQKATGLKKSQINIIELKQAEYDQYENEVKQNVKKCREILQILREIALKPDPLSEVEYIDELIYAETHAHKQGWEDRVRELRKFKEQAETIQKVSTNQSLLK